jgi:spermidine/putrescine transport system substrate-binding protein
MNDCASAISNGDIDRRKFLGLIGAAGLPMACRRRSPGRRWRRREQVRFDGWGGVVSEAFRKYAFDPYTEKTGVKVVDGTFGGGDEYLARSRPASPANTTSPTCPGFSTMRATPISA